MTTAILVSILMTLVAASTPILLAALGELVTEKPACSISASRA